MEALLPLLLLALAFVVLIVLPMRTAAGSCSRRASCRPG